MHILIFFSDFYIFEDSSAEDNNAISAEYLRKTMTIMTMMMTNKNKPPMAAPRIMPKSAPVTDKHYCKAQGISCTSGKGNGGAGASRV